MKQIAIKLDEATHKAAKIRAVMRDKSFMQYVIDLIKKDLATKNEQTR
ncbi:unknown [Enterocloster bolteae CAG:59]|nr:unknown [Enterocloster bolteae CAG:59]